MQKVKYFFSNLEYILGAIMAMVMVSILFMNVVSRYVFGYSFPWVEEVALVLFILSVYVGAIGATRRKQHLRIELLLNAIPRKPRLILNIVSNIIFIVANGFFIYGLIPVILNLYNRGFASPITGIPKWIIYTVLPISFVLISIRLIQDCVQTARSINHPDEPGEEEEKDAAEKQAELGV